MAAESECGYLSSLRSGPGYWPRHSAAARSSSDKLARPCYAPAMDLGRHRRTLPPLVPAVGSLGGGTARDRSRGRLSLGMPVDGAVEGTHHSSGSALAGPTSSSVTGQGAAGGGSTGNLSGHTTGAGRCPPVSVPDFASAKPASRGNVRAD